MSPSAIAIVRVQAFPGQVAALGRHLNELLEQVRQQPGCQSGELLALAGAKAQQWLGQLGSSELALGLEFESRRGE